MKLNIYLPDDLGAEVRAKRDVLNLSRICQDALWLAIAEKEREIAEKERERRALNAFASLYAPLSR